MGAVVIDISMSLGGFITGPNEGIEHPLGEDDGRLHDCPSGFRPGRASLSGSVRRSGRLLRRNDEQA
jgi:hypothetical protein